jgi:small-conductance mechanosensitive channel
MSGEATEASAAAADVTEAVAGVEELADRLVSGFEHRITALQGIGSDIDSLADSFAAGGTSGTAILLQIAFVVALVSAIIVLLPRIHHRGQAPAVGWRRFILSFAAILVALVAGFAAARFIGGTGMQMRTLRLWVGVTIVAFLVVRLLRAILSGSRGTHKENRSAHIARMTRDFSIALVLAITATAVMITLRRWNVGEGLDEAIGTALAIPIYLLFGLAIWRNRRTMAAAVAGPRPRSRLRTRLARVWPAIVIGFLVITFLSTEAAMTMGSSLSGSTILLTALTFLLAPHLDALIGRWARAGLESSRISIVAAAARQTARFGVLVVLLAMLGILWTAPLAAGFGVDLRLVNRDAFGIALIALAAAYLWNVVGTVTSRALRAEMTEGAGDGSDIAATPRSRLGTLVPLLSTVGKSSILVLAILSMLVSIGVNVWPLITGLSVFGLAIGFGSQTLVKDIVSGLFFLIDDAFRMGEYIESSGAKGTVEKISVRSVSLRNSRGALATLPYGQIGKILNFSRDWVVEKMTFRVAFDTDVEKVRKIFRKIGEQIAADPELAGDLLEPFKSQGIADVEDGTLVIRAKFKAKAGKQTMIRRAALIAVHKAFLENGIKAVSKPLAGGPGPDA